MKALDLRRTMSPAVIRPFDYAALGDNEIERQLKEAAVQIRGLQRAAVIDIGQALLAVKDDLPHGKFLDWVEAEFPFGRRTAVNMMQAAATFGERWEAVSHLPTTVLYRLASPSTPAAVRDAVFDLRPGEVITPRGVRAAIDATKKAEQPKKPSLKRDEREAQRASQEARWRARDEKDRREREKADSAAEASAERVKAMLGAHFDEFCTIMVETKPWNLSNALFALVQAHRASKTDVSK